ncbi:hypothetical protein F4779DRAFT_96167 [Xylariaceae sp. FL0662B]|nr:hypothetical protein F4779DRAFT_96167 [Xylariaceae sp. FL0662B]
MSAAPGSKLRSLLPEGANLEILRLDAPDLVPLIEICPDIHIYTPSSPYFTPLNRVTSANTDAVPLALVRPITESEISATVSLCSSLELTLAIRTGGNDVGDRCRVDGGVVIDMRSMDSIMISPDRTWARVGGGVASGKLLQFLDQYELDTPCGWGHRVGYAAWACGGGYGVEVGMRGLGVDQILSGRIVTASGEVVVADDVDGDADAYWALRGGGAGIIGVVSELTIRVYPRPRVYAGYVMFPLAEAEVVLGNFSYLFEGYRGIPENFPDNFAGEIFIVNPPGSGGLINHFFWWELEDDASDLPEAQLYLERIKLFGTVIAETVHESKPERSVSDEPANASAATPYKFLYSTENPMTETRLASSAASCNVPGFSAELGAIIIRHPLPTTASAIALHNCHGAGTRPDPSAAFADRTRHLCVGITGMCPYYDKAEREAIEEWSQEVLSEIQDTGLALERNYINFTPPQRGDGVLYFGEDGVRRMREIKQRLDPRGSFARWTPDLEL